MYNLANSVLFLDHPVSSSYTLHPLNKFFDALLRSEVCMHYLLLHTHFQLSSLCSHARLLDEVHDELVLLGAFIVPPAFCYNPKQIQERPEQFEIRL